MKQVLLLKQKHLTFAEISPRWAHIIEKYGVQGIYDITMLRMGPSTLSQEDREFIETHCMSNHEKCIVGEAHGGTDFYSSSYIGGCTECCNMGFMFCADNYLAAIPRFVKHWNEVHVGARE